MLSSDLGVFYFSEQTPKTHCKYFLTIKRFYFYTNEKLLLKHKLAYSKEININQYPYSAFPKAYL